MTRREAVILATCCSSLFMSGMDLTIVNLGLPSLQADLGGSLSDLQWVVSVYEVGVASMLIAAGTMGDRFGRRRVFQIGLCSFTLASALCAVSPSMTWLIAARAVQAVGGSMLNPLALSIVLGVFPDRARRAKAIGIWSAVFGLGMVLGPVVGGLVIGSLGWRAAFWLNVPVGLLTIAMSVLVLPESRAPRPRSLDPIGQASMVVLLGALTYAIIEAPRSGWVSSPTVIAAVLVIVASVAFVLQENRSPHPMIELRLFRSRPLSGAAAIGLGSSGLLAGVLLLASLYLQQVRGLAPAAAGIYLLPIGLMVAVCAPIAGRLVGGGGPRRPVLLAGVLLTSGCSLMEPAVSSGSDAMLLVGLATFAAGFGFVNAPLNVIAAGSLPPERVGLASAIMSTARLVGAALGAAVFGSVLAARLSDPVVDRFAEASALSWWLMSACGLAILAVGAVTIPVEARPAAIRPDPLGVDVE